MLKGLRKTLSGDSRTRRFGRKQDNSYQIANPRKIANLLSQAYRSRILILASIPGTEDQFTTALLDVREDDGFLILDGLVPQEGHNKFLQSGELELSGRLDGVDIRFKTRLIEDMEDSGLPLYKTELPPKLHYMQRRHDHRVSTGGNRMQFRSAYGSEHRNPVRGYVNDLSRDGVGLLLEDQISLHRNDILPACTIRLPEGNEVVFSLEIRFLHYNRQRGITRIGGKFDNIDKQSRRQIKRIVLEMDRKRCKRLRNKQEVQDSTPDVD